MKKIFATALIGLLFSTGCNKNDKVVTDFGLELGANTVTVSAEFSEDFALNLNGVFDLNIKGTDYGEIFLYGASNSTPFSAGVTVDVGVFKPEVWEGFAPTTTLPNGSAIPAWISPYELVAVDVPVTSTQFDIKAYVGYHSPYYLGVSLGLNFLDDHFPEGLSLSQSFKKDGDIWSEVVAYGPTKDADGNVIQHGGLFFVAKYDPALQQNLQLDENLFAGEWKATGSDAKYYNENPKAMRKLLKKVKKAIEEYNESQAQTLR